MGKQSSILWLVSNIQCQLGWWLRIDEHIFVVWATNQMINGEVSRKGCRLLLKPNFLGYWLLLLSCEQWGWSFFHFFWRGFRDNEILFRGCKRIQDMVNAAFLFCFVALSITYLILISWCLFARLPNGSTSNHKYLRMIRIIMTLDCSSPNGPSSLASFAWDCRVPPAAWPR